VCEPQRILTEEERAALLGPRYLAWWKEDRKRPKPRVRHFPGGFELLPPDEEEIRRAERYRRESEADGGGDQVDAG